MQKSYYDDAEAVEQQIEELRNQLYERKAAIKAHVDSVVSKYLSNLYEVETIFKYADDTFDCFTVLPDILDIKIRINRHLHPMRCDVSTKTYTAQFTANSKPSKKGGIFWRFEHYHVVGEAPVTNITTNAIAEFRKANNALTGIVNLRCENTDETFKISQGDLCTRIKIPSDIATVRKIISVYPYLNKCVGLLFKRYYAHPIIEYQQLTLTFLMIRWFRQSVLSVIPKDVVRLIAKEIWALRLERHVDDDCSDEESEE